METNTVASVLTSVGSVITWVVAQIGDLLTMVVTTPALLIPFSLGIAGGVIGLVHKLRH